jgi:hypothetical protein
MSIVDAQPVNTQDAAWQRGCDEAASAMTAMNLAAAALVRTFAMLLDTGGWIGWGITSIEHWATWKAGISRRRAEGLVRIARRRDELPQCWAAFEAGQLTEDAMVRIARRVPSEYDGQVAGLAPMMLVAQLGRVLACLPELPDPDGRPAAERERRARTFTRADGWVEGDFTLPPDEGALVLAGLAAARDADFRDRKDLAADEELAPGASRSVSTADALLRMAGSALDELDACWKRTGHRGERNQIVLHHHVDGAGQLGPGRLHLGEFVPDAVARYLACDAQVVINVYRDGRLLGITPSERTPNRRLRRYLEQRDGGCAHPLCVQRRWLHAHHLRHWEDGGLTVPANLVCLCPLHHRELHHGDFSIEGDPEAKTLVFRDRRGGVIRPPDFGADPLPQPPNSTFRPPLGERLVARDFVWN